MSATDFQGACKSQGRQNELSVSIVKDAYHSKHNTERAPLNVRPLVLIGRRNLAAQRDGRGGSRLLDAESPPERQHRAHHIPQQLQKESTHLSAAKDCSKPAHPTELVVSSNSTAA